MPTPSFVIIALVWAGTLNSSAANFKTAVNGASSGTLNTLNGSFGSDVRTTLNVTLTPDDVLGVGRTGEGLFRKRGRSIRSCWCNVPT